MADRSTDKQARQGGYDAPRESCMRGLNDIFNTWVKLKSLHAGPLYCLYCSPSWMRVALQLPLLPPVNAPFMEFSLTLPVYVISSALKLI
jgi:hypothetical protein